MSDGALVDRYRRLISNPVGGLNVRCLMCIIGNSEFWG